MAIKCEICGSTTLIKQGDSFICQNCGINYSKESVQAMLAANNAVSSDNQAQQSDPSKDDIIAKTSEVPEIIGSDDQKGNSTEKSDTISVHDSADNSVQSDISNVSVEKQSVADDNSKISKIDIGNVNSTVIPVPLNFGNSQNNSSNNMVHAVETEISETADNITLNDPFVQNYSSSTDTKKERSWLTYFPHIMTEKMKTILGGLGLSILLCVIFFNIKPGKKSGDSSGVKEELSSGDIISSLISEDEETNAEAEIVASTTTVTTTKTTTTTTPTTTEATTTTTAKPADAVENDYDVFETSLFVHVDEADTLPLRDKPNRDTSSIILRIPDKTRVDVLGYKDTGSEIWFRLDYEGTKGWARGGMLQPKNLNDIWNEEYDLPGMDKWRSKFILDEEYKMNSREVYANFQGTLYFQPDLSSGVQKRFKSSVFVRVYGVSYDSSEWYYVGTGDSALESEGFGWVHSSQLSW